MKRRGFEFLSIFIAVISAFALNNWNENRRENTSESKILTEISNGLEKDLVDVQTNQKGHRHGIAASNYFTDLLTEKEVNRDSLMRYYFSLTRDYISIQNTAGYETLKSRGLELIKNDSLRLQIITLYEHDYNSLKKLEEEYAEMQYQESYFKEINAELAPNFIISTDGNVTGINLPLQITEEKKKILLLYMWKIKTNRNFILNYYKDIESRITKLQKKIIQENES